MMTEGELIREAWEDSLMPHCEVCGATDDLIRAKLMGVRRDPPPCVCAECYMIWYEYGATSAREILAIRARKG